MNTGRHRHHAGEGHVHRAGPDADRRYLRAGLALIGGFVVIEAAVAFTVHSLALLADAGHMLTDAGALGGALFVAGLAGRPPSGSWTYGFGRSEILSAAANGVSLVAVAVLVLYEAVRRLVHPPAVGGTAVLAVALVGVAVNLAVAWVLSRANRASLNVEGAFLHIVTDLYGFVATAAAGLVVMVTGFRRADPIASLVVVALMAKAAWRLLGAAGRVLAQAAPDDLDLDEVRRHMLELPHVREVHDLHVWALTRELPVITAHVVVEDTCFRDDHAPQILDELQACLGGHFDVEHSTFQLEAAGHLDHEPGMHD
ncbi:MAG TPA: cation diffusion facilitator family transporter [Acidimicrobiales bacterium]|nr:cation diffusion facilitator family transporter [Acidimicrobiales bacterium]